MVDRLVRDSSFVVVDVETTGLSPENDGICEIAAVKIERCSLTGRFSTLVNPGMNIPQAAVQIHGIDNSLVSDSPEFSRAWQDVSAFIGDLPVMGYNVKFDIDFINCQNGKSNNRLLTGPFIDIVKIVRFALAGLESYNLEEVAGRLNLKNSTFHRALADAETAGKVFLEFVPLLEEKGLSKVKHLVSVFGIEGDSNLDGLNSDKVSFLRKSIDKRQPVKMDYFSFNAAGVYNWKILPLEIEKKETKTYLWAVSLKDSRRRCFNLRRIIALESL